MSERMKRCGGCGRYTYKTECPVCGSPAYSPVPPKYSPEDKYGAYRRKAIEEAYGENGKYSKV